MKSLFEFHGEKSSKTTRIAVPRSDDANMIPAYNAYNRRNGNWTNTKPSQKKLCDGRNSGYDTFEICRDYGFVERFSRHFIGHGMEFDLVENVDRNLVLYWVVQH
jgi:hypothetical protein